MCLFAGCNYSYAGLPTTTPETTPVATTTETTAATRPLTETWVDPAEINIGKFYAGAEASWDIIIHNGNGVRTETRQYKVGTDPNETAWYVVLNRPLAGDDIKYVRSVASDNPKDLPLAYKYEPETEWLWISGLAESSSRILTVEYEYWTQFSLGYRLPTEFDKTDKFTIKTGENDQFNAILLNEKVKYVISVESDNPKDKGIEYGLNGEFLTVLNLAKNETRVLTVIYHCSSYREGYAHPPLEASEWVTFTEPNPILMPYETRNIEATLRIPKDAVITEKKWEFWTTVFESGQGAIETGAATRWLVSMK